MSRDRDVSRVLDSRPRPESGGREMPRGGRSGGATRPRGRMAGDPREALTRQLDLPRGEARERVRMGLRTYRLRGSDVRVLATVGAFRVADARDLTPAANVGDRWHGELEHLRQARLVTLTPHVLDGERTALVTLTRAGQALLEQHRHPSRHEAPQAYYAGLVKPREVTHDAQLSRVYVEAADRLHASGARVRRVVMDYELKRDYQRFLQERNHVLHRLTGRPDRSEAEIREWAEAHALPVVDRHVQFPDLRVEYEREDGRRYCEDHELATGHYTTRQMAAKRAAGFQIHQSGASRLGTGRTRRGGTPFDPHTAEKVLR